MREARLMGNNVKCNTHTHTLHREKTSDPITSLKVTAQQKLPTQWNMDIGFFSNCYRVYQFY
jgi:hypothetical protein